MEWQELDHWTFGGEGVDADALVRLVLAGKKRATTSCLAAYEAEGEPLPEPGERSVLTWADETPAAVLRLVEYGIQTSRVEHPKPPSVFKRVDKLAEACKPILS